MMFYSSALACASVTHAGNRATAFLGWLSKFSFEAWQIIFVIQNSKPKELIPNQLMSPKGYCFVPMNNIRNEPLHTKVNSMVYATDKDSDVHFNQGLLWPMETRLNKLNSEDTYQPQQMRGLIPQVSYEPFLWKGLRWSIRALHKGTWCFCAAINVCTHISFEICDVELNVFQLKINLFLYLFYTTVLSVLGLAILLLLMVAAVVVEIAVAVTAVKFIQTYFGSNVEKIQKIFILN